MMSSTADSDPFIQFQNEVLTLLDSTRQSFSSYLRIRSLTPSLTSPELASALADLTQNLTDLSADLTDLQASVGAIEQDPYKFGLDIPEVSRRRRFVDEVSNEVIDIREELEKHSPSSSSSGAQRPGGSSSGGGGYNQSDQVDDSYAQFNLQQQQELLADQDLALEDVSRTVGNLREQAHEMNRELEEQVEMLEEVDKDATRVEDKLRKGVRDLNGFIRKNEDTASSCCIGVLIFVLIILLVLVLVL